MLTITRKKLIKIAFKAIKQYKGDVSLDNRKHLLYAACTVDQIALGTWVLDNKCGCLVGSAYIDAANAVAVAIDTNWNPEDDWQEILSDEYDEKRALLNLGSDFDTLLEQIVDPSGNRDEATAAVKVID